MTYDPNQFLLTHLLQEVISRLGQVRALKATGGSTSTVVDTTISVDLQDDSFLGQHAFIVRDAGGAGAAPEGEYARCTGYAADTFTLSFAASSFSAAVGAGDRVILAKNSLYPLYDVLRVCNDTIRQLGRYPVVDTSLVTASNQTEYTLPLATKGHEILSVEVQGLTGDSNDNRRQAIYWRKAPAGPGSTETLIIPQQIDGRTLYITYLAEHPILESYADPVSEYLPRELVVSACALRVAEWKPSASKEILPILRERYGAALAQYPIEQFVRKVNGFPHVRRPGEYYPGDQNYA